MLGKKLGHPVKSEKDLMYPLMLATFSVQYSWKLVTMFVLISSMSLEMGHVGSKPRSLGQRIEEPTLVTKRL